MFCADVPDDLDVILLVVNARERIRSIVIVAVEHAAQVTSPAYDIGLTEDELREQHRRRLLER